MSARFESRLQRKQLHLRAGKSMASMAAGAVLVTSPLLFGAGNTETTFATGASDLSLGTNYSTNITSANATTFDAL